MATEAKTTETTAEETTVATTTKVTVIKSFRDKNDTKIRFEVGAELEFEEDRAKDVVDRGLAQYVEPVA